VRNETIYYGHLRFRDELEVVYAKLCGLIAAQAKMLTQLLESTREIQKRSHLRRKKQLTNLKFSCTCVTVLRINRMG